MSNGQYKALDAVREYLSRTIHIERPDNSDLIMFDDEVVIGYSQAEDVYYFRCYEDTVWGDKKDIRGWVDKIKDQTIIKRFHDLMAYYDYQGFEILEELYGVLDDDK